MRASGNGVVVQDVHHIDIEDHVPVRGVCERGNDGRDAVRRGCSGHQGGEGAHGEVGRKLRQCPQASYAMHLRAACSGAVPALVGSTARIAKCRHRNLWDMNQAFLGDTVCT